MERKQLRSLGLIGCGYWGPNILRNFYNAGLKVPLVADASPGRREWVSRRYPASSVVKGWEEVVDDKSVDAVAIATPPQTHYEIARAALENGKHVLIEKPMALKSAHCRELIKIADKSGLILMVDHIYVYVSPIRKIREMVVSGGMGELCYYDSVRINLGLFQTHVNVLWDLGPHDLSILDYIVGGLDVVDVSAAGNRLPGMEHEYQVYLNLKLRNGMMANIHLNWLSPVKVRKIIIAGRNLMTVFDETDPAEQLKIYDKGYTTESVEEKYRALGTYRLGNMQAPHMDGVEALQRVVQQFVTAVSGGAAPDASAGQGLRVVEVLEKAQELLEKK